MRILYLFLMDIERFGSRAKTRYGDAVGKVAGDVNIVEHLDSVGILGFQLLG